VPALSSPSLHLQVAGAMLVAVGLGHVALPKALGWSAEMTRLSLLNRQVSYVHTFFIGMACVQFGLLALFAHAELLRGGHLARAVLTGAVAFWGGRLLVQLLVFDSSLWRGRLLTVGGHLAFVGLWTYETAVFGWPLVHQV
jgi:hypothetical protein